MCSAKTCLTQVTTYSVSLSVSSTGLPLLLRTGPYDANSGTSASCLAYADWLSAAEGLDPASASSDVDATELTASARAPGVPSRTSAPAGEDETETGDVRIEFSRDCSLLTLGTELKSNGSAEASESPT